MASNFDFIDASHHCDKFDNKIIHLNMRSVLISVAYFDFVRNNAETVTFYEHSIKQIKVLFVHM